MDFEKLQAAFVALFAQLFPPVSSGAWIAWDADKRQALNGFIHTMNEMFNDTIRTGYDQQVWDGNKTGAFVGNTWTDPKTGVVVADKLRPVRKQTDKTAASGPVQTPEEMALAMLAKNTTATIAVTEQVPNAAAE